MNPNLLPTEMLVHIFSYLEPDDLRRLTGQVCVRWQLLSYHSYLWKRIRIDQQLQSPNEIMRMAHYSNLTRRHRIIFCRISNWTFLSSFPNPSNLRRLELESCVLSESNISKLVQTFPLIECVRLKYDNIDTTVAQQILQWVYLKEVDVSGSIPEPKTSGDAWLNLMAADKCQNLEHLSLNFFSGLNDLPLTNFMQSHGAKLKTFAARVWDLQHDGYRCLTQCCNLINLHLQDITQMTGVELFYLKELKSLEKLELKHSFKLSKQNLVDFFRESEFPKLQELMMQFCECLNDLSLKFMSKSCPTLKKLSFMRCKYVSDVGVEHIINGCSKLESLILNDTQIRGKCLVEITTKLPNLNLLDLIDSKGIRSDTVFQLRKTMPNVKVVTLY